MLTFSQKVYDNYLKGTQPVYTDASFSELLGSVEQLTIQAFLSGVSGTGPTLTVQVEHSCDGTRWMNRNATPEFNGIALGQGQTDPIPQSDGSVFVRPSLPRVRLRIQMGGTTPSGMIRIWVSGRSPAR